MNNKNKLRILFDRQNDRIHYLEMLLRTQIKIINDLRKQISHMQKDRENIAAPRDAQCSCCSGHAILVAKCGHYFCSLCIDRYHHVDCVSCELNGATLEDE